MYKIIAPDQVEQHWTFVAPWIAQAIGDSDTWSDLAEIKEKALKGFSTIWVGGKPSGEVDLVFVTEKWFLDGRPALVIRWLCGKDMHEWLQDLPVLENWAVNNGYQAVHIWGRPGWIRLCKPLGYKQEFTVLSKPLIRGLN